MKGIILKANPQAQIVDITHEIAPQDIWEAAFTLKSAHNQFPKGTIHLAVVDPGVGSGRRPIIAVTESYYFVGPDNGLFSLIYRDAERLRVHHITAGHYFTASPGPTFHGRDIFAPVAAWLTKGIPSGNFGDEITDFVKLNVPAPKRAGNSIDGHVIHADRFGNLITNITYRDLQSLIPEGIGYLSLLSGERSRMNVTAIEDSACYLIPRAPFLALLERQPAIHEFLTRAFITTYLDKAFSDVRATSLSLGDSERLLFTTPVGQLPAREPVAASAGIPIRDAAGIMSRNRVSSLVITDAAGAPVGIVIDRDLRDRVAAVARDGAEPVANIMSRPCVTVDAWEPCFDALVTMMRNNVHHLPVLEHVRLRRVITNHDLLLLIGKSPLSVVREIATRSSL